MAGPVIERIGFAQAFSFKYSPRPGTPAAALPGQVPEAEKEARLAELQALLHATRSGGRFAQGLSPRAGLALLRAARAYALLQGRAYVAPDDLYAVVVPVAAHRLRPAPGVAHDSAALLRALLQELG